MARIKNGTLASGFGMNQSVGAYSHADIEPVRNQLLSLNQELENESVRSMKIIK